MKIPIIGATGSIGRHLVPQALALQHEVTELVRDPFKLEAKLEVKSERLHVVTGDALDSVVVRTAVTNATEFHFNINFARLLSVTGDLHRKGGASWIAA